MKDQAELLLIEDNPADQFLTAEGLRESRWIKRLYTVSDGVEALEFLRRKPPYEDAPRPGLILLDLNLPKKNGCEVLFEMKKDANLRGIPVVIVTSSDAAIDIERSYDLGASCCLTKPYDLEDYLSMVRGIESFWLTWVVLPKGNHPA